MTKPSNKAELEPLSAKLKEVVTHLYDLELTAADFPADASDDLIHAKLYVSTVVARLPLKRSRNIAQRNRNRLVNDFAELEKLKDSTDLSVPQDVLEYIEAGRNPNVYTRQFSEAVTRESQVMNGKMSAHLDFAEMLGKCISAEYPELTAEVERASATTVKKV